MALPAHRSATERAALDAFADGARALAGDALLDLALYGSRARGEGHAESDLDVAVVLTPGGRAAHRRALIDLAFDVWMAHGGPRIEALVIDQTTLDDLRSHERLLARELERDRVAL